MQRGDVYLVDLDPTRGSESNKVRPAVVVSNNAANRTAERNRRGVITVVPVTSNTDRVHPFQVLLPAGEGGLTVDSKAQAEQVRSVDFERLRRRVGAITPGKLGRLDEALRLHLAL
jgi:mRNA interferase MazF